jgi:LysR family D-serine deaminase transcriptional activator
MPAVLRGELVIPVDYKIPSGMGYQLFCSREHVQRPRYQAFAQWLQRTIDEWLEIKEASLSATQTAAIADKVLGRNIGGGSDTGRTVKQSLAALRNKVTLMDTLIEIKHTLKH